MKGKITAVTLELFGIAVIGCGIGVELMMGAHIGLAVITIGSCFVVIGGVIWGKFMRRH